MLDVLTFGEALVEVMRTRVGESLRHAGTFVGPFPSGAPFIFTVQAARLGLQAACIGAVGADAFGDCLRDQLLADGVDTRGVHTLAGYTTGVAFVAYRADGSREFVFHARHAAAGQISAQMADEALFTGLRCLHIMGSSLSMHADALALGQRALALAKQHGAKISFDPNIRPQLMGLEQARVVFRPFLNAADVILPAADELTALYEAATVAEALDRLRAENPSALVIVTDGANGCTVYAPDQPARQIAGFAVEEVDPTGAGDCFDAGFLARWLAGDPPVQAARFANACGALAVTAQGPMAGAKRLEDVQAFIDEHARRGVNHAY